MNLIKTKIEFTSCWLFKLFFVIILITIVAGTYIRALLNIMPGSPWALYRDVIIMIFLYFSGCTLLLKHKIILNNRIDKVFFMLILFGLFEIIWTYQFTGSLFLSVFTFRLYLLVYLLYFPFVYFLRSRPGFIYEFLKIIKILFVISFIWAIVEFILLNFHIVPITTISSLLAKVTRGSTWSSYSNIFGSIDIYRGYGLIGHIVNAGIFCVVGLALFFPRALNRWDFNDKIYVFLGIFATICSFSKTAWLLMLVVFFILLLGIRGRKRFPFASLAISIVLVSFMYLNLQNFRGSVDASFRRLSDHYLLSFKDFLDTSIFVKAFGFGYEICPGNIETFGLSFEEDSQTSITIGNEVFFLAILRQWGITGFLLYLIVFIFMPLKIFFKSRDPMINGMALAIVIAGLSFIHYNAIFQNGLNVITCFLLAGTSVMYYDVSCKDRAI